LQKMFLVLAKQYFKDINLEKHCKTMSKWMVIVKLSENGDTFIYSLFYQQPMSKLISSIISSLLHKHSIFLCLSLFTHGEQFLDFKVSYSKVHLFTSMWKSATFV
jgi:hypothetical protein